MDFLLSLLTSAAVIFILANVMDSVRIQSYWSSVWVCLLIGLLNATIGFLIRLPLNVLTLFLLTFFVRLFVTAIIVKLVSSLTSSFHVKNWTAAFIIAVCLAAVSYLFDKQMLL